jgi:hypothetical protein
VQTSLKTKSNPQSERDVVSLACYRSRRGVEIADRIERAGDRAHARALAVADKLRHCSSCENVWYAEDIQNSIGELYEATGTRYACDERLCPACLAKRSRIARGKARAGIMRAGRRKGEIPYFITLTIPKMTASESGLLESIQLLLLAWRLFTKRDFFSEHVRAGVKGVEFTIGDRERLEREAREWLTDVDGWHPHIHFIAIAPRWIKAADLRAAWTDCYLSACGSLGFSPTINTKDGFLNCHLRFVAEHRKKRTRGTIPLDAAIIEACKYITKFESWLTIPESELLDIANIKRWPRMFELIGECRQSRDTGATDGASCHTSGEVAKPYLDTTDLNAADRAPPEGKKLPTSWRELGRMMIEQGRRAEWRVMLAAYVKKVQEFRRGQLACMYPFAVFRTLDGQRWNGALDYVLYEPNAGERIMQKLVDESDVWDAAVAGADRTEQRRAVEWQEREAWLSYVNDGPETPYGDVMRWYAYMNDGEPAKSKEEAIAFRQNWFVQGLNVSDQIETNELRAARAFAWELSSEYVRSNA